MISHREEIIDIYDKTFVLDEKTLTLKKIIKINIFKKLKKFIRYFIRSETKQFFMLIPK